jgi:hypothetical protein
MRYKRITNRLLTTPVLLLQVFLARQDAQLAARGKEAWSKDYYVSGLCVAPLPAHLLVIP